MMVVDVWLDHRTHFILIDRKTHITPRTEFCESCGVCEQYEFCGQATHEQPSCVMSDRRLNPEQNVRGFALIPYNPCTS